jgi:hypothetical protein
MCVTGIIAFPDYPSALCDYLLAKLIIFCVFGAFASCYALTIAHIDREFLAKLCTLAVAFELVAVFVALFYAAGALLITLELLSSLFLCGCCCLTIPLLDRAQARGALQEDINKDFISIILLWAACLECGDLMFVSGRRVAVEVGGGAEGGGADGGGAEGGGVEGAPVSITVAGGGPPPAPPNSFAASDARVTEKIRLIMTTARTAINMV